MRNISIIITLTIFSIKGYSQRNIVTGPVFGAAPFYVQVTAPICEDATDGLEFVWGDDFNGSSLDLTKWKVGWHWGLTYGTTCWADANQISFTGNSIKLGLNYNPANIPGSGNRDYAAGVISTPNEEYGYGYYEIRCKIPSISKHHPAFWLFGNCAQEIDVFEFVGLDKIESSSTPGADNLSICNPHKNAWYIPRECAAANPIMTYHSPEPSCNGQTVIGQRRSQGRTFQYSEWDVNPTPFDINHGCQYSQTVDVSFHDDWHTFGMKFGPEGITWYIDGVAKLTEYRYYTAQTIYDPATHEYYPGNYTPITNLADFCSNNSTDPIYEQVNLPNNSIKMSVILENFRDPDAYFNGYNLFDFVNNYTNWSEGFLEIDYFKYYRFSECNKNLEFCNTTQLSNYFNNVKAKNITLKAGCTITPSTNLDLKAIEEIKILSEFSSPSGFSAEIKNCIDGSIQRMANTAPASDSGNYLEPKRTILNKSTISEQTVASENELYYDNRFVIYPSPSNGQFIVKTTNNADKQLNILNNLGVIVYSNKFSSENCNLNLNLASGIYFVEIINNGIKSQQKIIIEN